MSPPDTTATAAAAAAPGAGTGSRRALKPGSFRPLDLGTLMFASAVTGVAVTAIMRDVGTPAWVVMAACTFAFSGTGEVAYASVIASGGGLAPALLAAMLVSSRFGLLAMSMTGRWPAPLWERIAVSHFSSEVAVAAAIEQRPVGPDAARRAFWQLAMATTGGWIIGSGIGLVLGQLGDTRRIGLDVVFPASFVGAVVNALRQRDSTVAVLLGAVAALALTPLLPAGLPVLCAAAGSLVALGVEPRRWFRPAVPVQAEPADGPWRRADSIIEDPFEEAGW